MIVIMIFVMSYTHFFFLSWLLPVFYPVIISNNIF